MNLKKLIPGVIVIFVFLAGCSGAPSAPSDSSSQPSRITVKDAWSRPTVGAADPTGVTYLVIENAGGPDKLLKVNTDAAEMGSVHETKQNNGMVEMSEVPGGLDIPANSTVTLKPAGLHIMLMNMKRELKAGDTFDVILSFQSAGDVAATVTVRDL